MQPFVLVAVDQDQEFGQGNKVSIPLRQLFELPLNDTCKGTKYPYGVPIEGVKKRRYEKELFPYTPFSEILGPLTLVLSPLLMRRTAPLSCGAFNSNHSMALQMPRGAPSTPEYTTYTKYRTRYAPSSTIIQNTMLPACRLRARAPCGP